MTHPVSDSVQIFPQTADRSAGCSETESSCRQSSLDPQSPTNRSIPQTPSPSPRAQPQPTHASVPCDKGALASDKGSEQHDKDMLSSPDNTSYAVKVIWSGKIRSLSASIDCEPLKCNVTTFSRCMPDIDATSWGDMLDMQLIPLTAIAEKQNLFLQAISVVFKFRGNRVSAVMRILSQVVARKMAGFVEIRTAESEVKAIVFMYNNQGMFVGKVPSDQQQFLTYIKSHPAISSSLMTLIQPEVSPSAGLVHPMTLTPPLTLTPPVALTPPPVALTPPVSLTPPVAWTPPTSLTPPVTLCTQHQNQKQTGAEQMVCESRCTTSPPTVVPHNHLSQSDSLLQLKEAIEEMLQTTREPADGSLTPEAAVGGCTEESEAESDDDAAATTRDDDDDDDYDDDDDDRLVIDEGAISCTDRSMESYHEADEDCRMNAGYSYQSTPGDDVRCIGDDIHEMTGVCRDGEMCVEEVTVGEGLISPHHSPPSPSLPTCDNPAVPVDIVSDQGASEHIHKTPIDCDGGCEGLASPDSQPASPSLPQCDAMALCCAPTHVDNGDNAAVSHLDKEIQESSVDRDGRASPVIDFMSSNAQRYTTEIDTAEIYTTEVDTAGIYTSEIDTAEIYTTEIDTAEIEVTSYTDLGCLDKVEGDKLSVSDETLHASPEELNPSCSIDEQSPASNEAVPSIPCLVPVSPRDDTYSGEDIPVIREIALQNAALDHCLEEMPVIEKIINEAAADAGLIVEDVVNDDDQLSPPVIKTTLRIVKETGSNESISDVTTGPLSVEPGKPKMGAHLTDQVPTTENVVASVGPGKAQTGADISVIVPAREEVVDAADVGEDLPDDMPAREEIVDSVRYPDVGADLPDDMPAREEVVDSARNPDVEADLPDDMPAREEVVDSARNPDVGADLPDDMPAREEVVDSARDATADVGADLPDDMPAREDGATLTDNCVDSLIEHKGSMSEPDTSATSRCKYGETVSRSPCGTPMDNTCSPRHFLDALWKESSSDPDLVNSVAVPRISAVIKTSIDPNSLKMVIKTKLQSRHRDLHLKRRHSVDSVSKLSESIMHFTDETEPPNKKRKIHPLEQSPSSSNDKRKSSESRKTNSTQKGHKRIANTTNESLNKERSKSKEVVLFKEILQSKNGTLSKNNITSVFNDITKYKDMPVKDEIEKSKSQLKERRDHEKFSSREGTEPARSRDRSSVKDVTRFRDRSAVKDVSRSRDRSSVKDVKSSRDRSSFEDVTRSRDGSSVKDVTISRDRSSVKDVTRSRDRSLVKDVTSSRDRSSFEDVTRSRDGSSVKDVTISRDRSSVKDVIRSRDRSLVKDVTSSRDRSSIKEGSKSRIRTSVKEVSRSRESSLFKEVSRSRISPFAKDTSRSRDHSFSLAKRVSRSSMSLKEGSRSEEKPLAKDMSRSMHRYLLEDVSRSYELMNGTAGSKSMNGSACEEKLKLCDPSVDDELSTPKDISVTKIPNSSKSTCKEGSVVPNMSKSCGQPVIKSRSIPLNLTKEKVVPKSSEEMLAKSGDVPVMKDLSRDGKGLGDSAQSRPDPSILKDQPILGQSKSRISGGDIKSTNSKSKQITFDKPQREPNERSFQNVLNIHTSSTNLSPPSLLGLKNPQRIQEGVKKLSVKLKRLPYIYTQNPKNPPLPKIPSPEKDTAHKELVGPDRPKDNVSLKGNDQPTPDKTELISRERKSQISKERKDREYQTRDNRENYQSLPRNADYQRKYQHEGSGPASTQLRSEYSRGQRRHSHYERQVNDEAQYCRHKYGRNLHHRHGHDRAGKSHGYGNSHSPEFTRLREKQLKFVGRYMYHMWIEEDGTRKWYTGRVLKAIAGEDGAQGTEYEILYEGEDTPFQVDHLLEDYMEGSIQFAHPSQMAMD